MRSSSGKLTSFTRTTARCPLIIEAFRRNFTRVVPRTYVFFDHVFPAPPTVKIANLQKEILEFAGGEQGIPVIQGQGGISHQLAVEMGLADNARIVVGADSHTPTLGGPWGFSPLG